VGGSLSLASGSISLENGLNVTKLFLAILTVGYDLIFMFQHYVLYRNNDGELEEILAREVEDLLTISTVDG
jgi:hypothetical protein